MDNRQCLIDGDSWIYRVPGKQDDSTCSFSKGKYGTTLQYGNTDSYDISVSHWAA